MNTTLVFAELLTVGSLSVFAVALAMMGLGFDHNYLKILSSLEQVLLSIPGIALIYALGMIVDGVADKALSKIGDEYKTEHNVQPCHSLISLTLAGRSNIFLEKFLEYIRIRIRITRAFIFNSFFILPLGVWAGITLGLQGWQWFAA